MIHRDRRVLEDGRVEAMAGQAGANGRITGDDIEGPARELRSDRRAHRAHVG